jgi:hypothetical protein
MKTPFLLALSGIVALGVGAVLVILAGSQPQGQAEASARPPPSGARSAESLPLAPAPFAALPPIAEMQTPRVDPAPVPLTQAPVSAPVRAAPPPAPELAERLESEDQEARSDAMLELRQRRQQSSMEWLNRRKRR